LNNFLDIGCSVHQEPGVPATANKIYTAKNNGEDQNEYMVSDFLFHII
jgi:hypothetical protein